MLGQSVSPNRYASPVAPPAGSRLLERQQQAQDAARRNQDEAYRRAEQDRIDTAIDANRQRLEADRARYDRQRALASDPAQAERLRLEYEQRRQASAREREALERQRAAAGSGALPAQP